MYSDLRMEKTEKLLRKAAMSLLWNRQPGKISVTALCKSAGISRSTFYVHYDNVAELLKVMQEEIVQEYSETLSRITRSCKSFSELYHLALRYTFQLSQDIGPMANLIFSGRFAADNIDDFENILYQFFLSRLPDQMRGKSYEAFFRYVTAGSEAVVRYTVLNGIIETHTAEEWTNYVETFLYQAQEIFHTIDDGFQRDK